jgi:hypothetical protein
MNWHGIEVWGDKECLKYFRSLDEGEQQKILLQTREKHLKEGAANMRDSLRCESCEHWKDIDSNPYDRSLVKLCRKDGIVVGSNNLFQKKDFGCRFHEERKGEVR